MKTNVFPGVREQLKNQYIKRIVGRGLSPGDRIEPVRVMVKNYGVSHITASTVLKDLAEEGWVESHVGRGSFVTPHPLIKNYLKEHRNDSGLFTTAEYVKGTIYFLYCNSKAADNSSYHFQIFSTIKEELKDSSCKIVPCILSDLDVFTKIVEENDALALIVSNIEQHVNSQAYAQLKDLHIPVLQYGMHSDLFQSNYIMPDNYAMGVLAGKYLLDNNHKNIQYVTALSATQKSNEFFNQHHFKLRQDGVADTYYKAGITIKPTIAWHIEDANSRQIMSALLNSVKNKTEGYPTALVVGNCDMATELSYLAEMMEVNVPRDLSIIAFIKRNKKNKDGPNLTMVDFDKKSMGTMLLHQLQYLLRSPENGPVTINLPVTLIEGDSVCQL